MKMASTAIPRFIVEDHIKQIREIGSSSHVGLRTLADSLQALLDSGESRMPLVTELAHAFKDTEETIMRDSTIIKDFMFHEQYNCYDISADDVSRASELPWVVARLAGIRVPTSLTGVYTRPELLEIINKKNKFIYFEVSSLQDELTAMTTLLQLANRMSAEPAADASAIKDIEVHIFRLLEEKFNKLGDILEKIYECLCLPLTWEKFRILQRQFKPYVQQAAKESQQENNVV